MYAEDIIGEYQAGFRHNRSTTDQIFTLRQVLEKRWEYAEETHILFIDFQQAYDSLHRESLWGILRLFGIPSKLIRLIQSLYRFTTSKVRTGGSTAPPLQLILG